MVISRQRRSESSECLFLFRVGGTTTFDFGEIDDLLRENGRSRKEKKESLYISIAICSRATANGIMAGPPTLSHASEHHILFFAQTAGEDPFASGLASPRGITGGWGTRLWGTETCSLETGALIRRAPLAIVGAAATAGAYIHAFHAAMEHMVARAHPGGACPTPETGKRAMYLFISRE